MLQALSHVHLLHEACILMVVEIVFCNILISFIECPIPCFFIISLSIYAICYSIYITKNLHLLVASFSYVCLRQKFFSEFLGTRKSPVVYWMCILVQVLQFSVCFKRDANNANLVNHLNVIPLDKESRSYHTRTHSTFTCQ